ncbi:MAG: acyl-CoA dehydrogenase, partial [Burkholderiales bacterium]
LRDARITTIYEGTTGIQANDLVGRKIAREGGATAKGWLAHLKAFDAELARSGNADVKAIRASLATGAAAVDDSVDYIVANAGKDVLATFAGAVPFLMLMGIVAGGWQMARAALAAERSLGAGDKAFYEAKLATARFYADQVLVQAPALRDTVTKGASAVMSVPEDSMLAA